MSNVIDFSSYVSPASEVVGEDLNEKISKDSSLVWYVVGYDNIYKEMHSVEFPMTMPSDSALFMSDTEVRHKGKELIFDLYYKNKKNVTMDDITVIHWNLSRSK